MNSTGFLEHCPASAFMIVANFNTTFTDKNCSLRYPIVTAKAGTWSVIDNLR